jgi:hypothetical protein
MVKTAQPRDFDRGILSANMANLKNTPEFVIWKVPSEVQRLQDRKRLDPVIGELAD